MKKHVISAVVFAVFLMVSSPGYSDYIQQGMNGSVNWSNNTVEATGIGVPPEKYYGKPQARPMAIRAAKLDAYRNLLEMTNGVRIDSSTTVKDFAVESDVISSNVQGLVRNAQLVDEPVYMSDGTVEVKVKMPLTGEFSQIVLPPDIKPANTGEPVTAAYTPPAAASDPPPAEAPPAEASSGASFTGLVVDAKGLGAKPAMSPKVLDENGQEVYGASYVSREYAVQQGMSGYSKDINSAKENQRVTDNPLIVKGIKTKGPGHSDIVISNSDADKIRNAADNLSFMKKCKVMIVLD